MYFLSHFENTTKRIETTQHDKSPTVFSQYGEVCSVANWCE